MSKSGLTVVSRTLLILAVMAPLASSQQTVADLKYAEMAHYSWMRLASIVPEVTDRVILPVGTIEAHGATCIGSDTYIPVNLAELAAKNCNALIAPAVTHGATGLNIATHPGSIRIRPEILVEYLVDVLEGLVQSGFKNVFILNGHGGNTESIEAATNRIFEKYNGKIRILISDWWTIPKAEEFSMEAFGVPEHDIGAHGGLEEAALNQAINPDFFDWDVFEKLGAENVANNFEPGYRALPRPYTMGDYGYYPTKDVEAAKKFTQMIADYYAETFNKAVEKWNFLEKHDNGLK